MPSSPKCHFSKCQLIHSPGVKAMPASRLHPPRMLHVAHGACHAVCGPSHHLLSCRNDTPVRLVARPSLCVIFYYCGCKLVRRGEGGWTTAVYVVSGQAVTTAVLIRKNTSGYHRCILGKLDKPLTQKNWHRNKGRRVPWCNSGQRKLASRPPAEPQSEPLVATIGIPSSRPSLFALSQPALGNTNAQQTAHESNPNDAVTTARIPAMLVETDVHK